MLLKIVIGMLVFGIGVTLAYFYGSAVGAGVTMKDIYDVIGDEGLSEIERKANEVDSETANRIRSTLRLVDKLK